VIVPYRIIWSWYTGRWWVGCYIWYSEEGPGRAGASPSPVLAVPNVTVHPSTASVPIAVWLYNGPLLSGFSVAIKRVNTVYRKGHLPVQKSYSSSFQMEIFRRMGFTCDVTCEGKIRTTFSMASTSAGVKWKKNEDWGGLDLLAVTQSFMIM